MSLLFIKYVHLITISSKYRGTFIFSKGIGEYHRQHDKKKQGARKFSLFKVSVQKDLFRYHTLTHIGIRSSLFLPVKITLNRPFLPDDLFQNGYRSIENDIVHLTHNSLEIWHNSPKPIWTKENPSLL